MRYGTLETTRSEAYYRYQAYGEPDGPQALDYFFWIVRRGDETILVDTGFDPDVGRRRGRTLPDRAGRGDGAARGRPRDRLARRAHPPALRPHRQPRPLPRRRAARRGARARLLARPARAPRAVRPRGRGRASSARSSPRSTPGACAAWRAARRSPRACTRSCSAATRPGRSRSASTRVAGWVVLASDARALLRGARARPALRRHRRPGRDVRGLRHAARAVPAPGAHLVPGHDAEVMTRYPRVDGAGARLRRGDPMTDDRRRALREAFIEARGFWTPLWEGLLDLDPDFFEAYLELLVGPVAQRAARAEGQGARAARDGRRRDAPLRARHPPARAQRDRARRHRARSSWRCSSSTSTLGIHACNIGVPILVEELEAAGQPIDRELDERRREVKADFEAKRGYWHPFWDDILALDPEFLAAYTQFSGGPVDARRARAQGQGDDLHRLRRRGDAPLRSPACARTSATRSGSGPRGRRSWRSSSS